MTQPEVKNLAASVKARLANLARAQREDFQELLSRYGRERLLYRLSVSEYRERFILKGALLFAYWTGAPHRPTRDVDLLGHGAPEIAVLEEVFRDLCKMEVQPDGLGFQPDSVKGERIKDDEEYEGNAQYQDEGLLRRLECEPGILIRWSDSLQGGQDNL